MSLLTFAEITFAVLASLAVAGAYPTWKTAGTAGLQAMGAACTLSFAAAVASFAAINGWRDRSPGGMLKRMGAAMAIRLVVVLAGAAVLVLSSIWPVAPLLIWIAIAYMAALCVETIVVVRRADANKTGV